MVRNENYKNDLLADLRNDLEFAAEYLSAAKADSKEAFLVALRDVAEAQKGIQTVAREANVNRENLYRALSREGNPRIETLDAVLAVLGIAVKFVPAENAAASQPSGNPVRPCETTEIAEAQITNNTGSMWESSLYQNGIAMITTSQQAAQAKPYPSASVASMPAWMINQFQRQEAETNV
jgi:probable addiction module antidote protein